MTASRWLVIRPLTLTVAGIGECLSVPRLMRILNAAQMREADRFTIEEIGIPSLVLMENAGRQVVAAIESAYEAKLDGRVAVLCGKGNNGGDGFVVARTLLQHGIETSVFVIGAVAEIRGDARTNLDILG